MSNPYEFKSIADTEVVQTPSDSATVLIVENGDIKQTPKESVGGNKDKWDAILYFIDSLNPGNGSIISGSYKNIYDKLSAEEWPKVLIKYEYGEYSGNRNKCLLIVNGFNKLTDGSIVMLFDLNSDALIINPDNSLGSAGPD